VAVTAGLVLAVGCSDRFGVCHVGDCVAHPEVGGASGDASDTPAVAGKTGEPLPAVGGADGSGGRFEQPSEGGTPEVGGAGGAPDRVETPACEAGYHDWLSSSFSFPDGDVIGTADFPSMPWVPTGQLAIASGRVTGTGSALISQGSAFSYTGLRLRFRGRFTGSHQTITVTTNAAADGDGGLRITLDSAGELVVNEGQAARGQIDFESLESGVDWFVETTITGPDGVVSLSKGNYPGEAGSSQKAVLTTTPLKQSAVGKRAAFRLDSAAGISPALDELSFAQCGKPAPEYEARLVDDFERSDSANLGEAQVPASATWVVGALGGRIVDGGFQAGEAKIPLDVPLAGLRIRTTVDAVTGGAHPSLWADVFFGCCGGPGDPPGFRVWGSSLDSFIATGLFVGGNEVTFPGVSALEKYFVEMDRDGSSAVVSVRRESFEGRLVAVQYSGKLSGTPSAESFLSLGASGGDGTRFEDIRVDVYPMH